MYDPELGVFHTPDLMAAFTPGISPYAYAYDNPVNLIDDYGLGGIPHPWRWWKEYIKKHIFKPILNLFGVRTNTIGNVTPRGKTVTPLGQSHGTEPQREVQHLAYINPLQPRELDTESPSETIIMPPENNSFGRKAITPPQIYSITFHSNSDQPETTEQNAKFLRGLLLSMIDDPTLYIEIAGNTGTIPGYKDNGQYELNGQPSSLGNIQSARARAIKRYLEANGILPSRIKTRNGKDYPDRSGFSVTITRYK